MGVNTDTGTIICKVRLDVDFPLLFETEEEAQAYIDSFNFEYDNMIVVPIKTADHE